MDGRNVWLAIGAQMAAADEAPFPPWSDELEEDGSAGAEAARVFAY